MEVGHKGFAKLLVIDKGVSWEKKVDREEVVVIPVGGGRRENWSIGNHLEARVREQKSLVALVVIVGDIVVGTEVVVGIGVVVDIVVAEIVEKHIEIVVVVVAAIVIVVVVVLHLILMPWH